MKARFRDCLSRQVTEAISIIYTKDQLLNSKNEYMANCLTRICVEENRFERKKSEREEVEQEEKDKLRLFNFKERHRRPKRSRAASTTEPACKRMKLYLKAGNPPEDRNMDLGDWLAVAEQRCQRSGDLKRRLENEREMVLEKMSARARDRGHQDDGGEGPLVLQDDRHVQTRPREVEDDGVALGRHPEDGGHDDGALQPREASRHDDGHGVDCDGPQEDHGLLCDGGRVQADQRVAEKDGNARRKA